MIFIVQEGSAFCRDENIAGTTENIFLDKLLEVG